MRYVPAGDSPLFNSACFLAAHGVFAGDYMPVCEGRLVRCHVIPQEVLRRLWESVHAPPREVRLDLTAVAALPDLSAWARRQELLDDRRTWVLGCAGAHGNGGHHRHFDRTRRLRLPRAAIPLQTQRLAERLGLAWWLDQEYGNAS